MKKLLKKFYKDLNFEILEEIFSIDKLNKMITSNINDKDYFLYSLLNVNQILKNNQNYLLFFFASFDICVSCL